MSKAPGRFETGSILPEDDFLRFAPPGVDQDRCRLGSTTPMRTTARERLLKGLAALQSAPRKEENRRSNNPQRCWLLPIHAERIAAYRLDATIRKQTLMTGFRSTANFPELQWLTTTTSRPEILPCAVFWGSFSLHSSLLAAATVGRHLRSCPKSRW